METQTLTIQVMSQEKPNKTLDSLNVNFALLNIEVLSSQLCYPEMKTIETKEFKFKIESNASFTIEKNQVFVTILVRVMDEAMQTLFGSIQTGIAFKLENLEGLLIKDDEGNQNLPIPLIEILNSISISTTRGVMFSRFMGTYLGSAILPIIDPKAMTASLGKAQ